MTFDERLAALGVDLSDMPKVHSYEKRFAVAKNIFGIVDKELINRMNRACDLIEIIDRMETRIVNLTGERDWLLEYYGANDGSVSCSLCIHSEEPNDSAICAKCNYSGPSQFERADVPVGWRTDDD